MALTASTAADAHRRPGAAAGRLRSAAVWTAVGLGLVAVGLLVAARPVAALGIVVLGFGVTLSIAQPVLMAFAAVLALSVVPTYAAPQFGPILLYPSVLAGWGAAAGGLAAAIARKERLGFTIVDCAMGLMLLSNVVSVIVGAREVTDLAGLVWKTLGPYLGIRLLIPRLDWRWIPQTFSLALLVTLPFVLLESALQSNPFSALDFNPEESFWAASQFRFGTIRAEGAWGHPISLSQFAGSAMLLALGAAVLSRERRPRRVYYWTLLAGAVVMALTFSRTGWIILAVGVAIIAVTVAGPRTRSRLLGTLAGICVLGGVLLVVTGLDTQLLRLVSDDSLEGSNNYREILIRRALSGEGLSWFGLRNSSLGLGIDSGVGSIDNAYLSVAADWGYAGAIVLGLVGASVAAVLWRVRGTVAALVPAVTLANFIGLVTVAINNQTQFWLWMLVGACGGTLAAARPPARSG